MELRRRGDQIVPGASVKVKVNGIVVCLLKYLVAPQAIKLKRELRQCLCLLEAPSLVS